MTHFRSIKQPVRDRLAARGIDPERSAESWLRVIRDGRFPLTPEGLPAGPRDRLRAGTSFGMAIAPIPLAVVIGQKAA